MQYLTLVCDQRGKQTKESEAINWIRTSVAGIDALTFGDKPIQGHFCSRECCAKWFLGEQESTK